MLVAVCVLFCFEWWHAMRVTAYEDVWRGWQNGVDENGRKRVRGKVRRREFPSESIHCHKSCMTTSNGIWKCCYFLCDACEKHWFCSVCIWSHYIFSTFSASFRQQVVDFWLCWCEHFRGRIYVLRHCHEANTFWVQCTRRNVGFIKTWRIFHFSLILFFQPVSTTKMTTTTGEM